MSAVCTPWRPLSDERLELGEGARWIDGRFVFVDLLAGVVFGSDGESGQAPAVVHRSDVPVGAVAQAAGGWIAAAGEGIVRIGADGAESWLARPAAGRATAMRMNDAVADPDGRFWAGAMPYDGTEGAGFLVRADRDGSVHRVLDGLTIPNGPAFSPDGGTMYLADTPAGRIFTAAVTPGAGALGELREFARLTEGGPDGMTVDGEGCLWVAVWGASCLHRYGPDGVLRERIPVPATQPTSIAISPAPPYRILVTTAAHGLDAPERHDGRVLVAGTTVPGVPAASYSG
ncbi:SMP-30/gluconolactonase/LRE family protein [Sediminivirga luteola]|uniref:Calcium-binding protein n=1 Tax=Sediminivirga luteola TaxID=1774748 RepID=A0A8J2XJB9_9MICO|nr:SMP-30/gluconolactonase/LRE family protein [Sediminivirga luteola]MCI2264411.1 SMP-30/gluconolactonase/LRE family protein [Sediminivirga luteola]GGA05994.1 calcium-binding protein [Sediminivirga luteola]